MKVLHIICKNDPNTNRPMGVTQIEPKVNRYMSCCWDLDIEEMKELIGGMIFFHNTKTTKSKLGGKVLKIHPIKMNKDYVGPYYDPKVEDFNKRSDRMMFEFEVTKDGREVDWRGKDYMMSYVGGILEIKD